MRAHPGGGRCCPEQEEGESAAGGSGAGGDSAIEQGGQGSALAPSPVSGVRREVARGGGRGVPPWGGGGRGGGGLVVAGSGRGQGSSAALGGGSPAESWGVLGVGDGGWRRKGYSGGDDQPPKGPIRFISKSECTSEQGRLKTKKIKKIVLPPSPPPPKEILFKKSCLAQITKDNYDYSPSGKKFRSKPQLARYLGNTVDLSSFDFRTGKMMPSKLQKNKQRLRNDPLNQNKGKPDLNTTLPIRQTASIFKQPVTKVTNHPNNKVKSDPQRMNEQPRQLFWEKRLQGLSASDVTEQIIKTMELPKGLQGVGPGSNDETLLSAVASALHTSSAPITGQVSPAVEKNPAVWLNTSQPLCKAFIVTDEDIRKQEERVQQVRKKLEEALMADILSRAADTEEMDIEMDSGDEA
uniref:Methyl-CpG binding domain protein 2 n=1 Tax=Myotis lucifugus TaxID=59463 RepID=G1PEY9_MYOLU